MVKLLQDWGAYIDAPGINGATLMFMADISVNKTGVTEALY
jgi:hypothetical protein